MGSMLGNCEVCDKFTMIDKYDFKCDECKEKEDVETAKAVQ